MTIEQIHETLRSSEYDFLRTGEHLGENIVLLTVGGSHSYGTEREGSDLDIRGCALDSSRDILLGKTFENVVDSNTDTSIYAFRKLVTLLSESNPNSLEMLGLRPEHYLYVSDVGQQILDNSHMFLSKQIYNTFVGYAKDQLHKLENFVIDQKNRLVQEQHVLRTIEESNEKFMIKYESMGMNGLNLYVSEHPEPRILMDVDLKGYPLKDFVDAVTQMQRIQKAFSDVGKRNKHAITHDKLGKHMMNLIRMYLTCADALEKEVVITHRPEHDLLMDAINNRYLQSDYSLTPEFYEVWHDLQKRLDYAFRNTSLPDEPDYKRIDEFVLDVHSEVVGCK